MWSWNQFRNLPKNQGLSAQEQARQYFIHQSNMMMEASSAAVAAASSAAGAGAGGSKKKELALTLTFDDIENANSLVGDATNVSDWNTFFDLPTYGNSFTSVQVVGNEVNLIGGSDITLRTYIFNVNTHLISIIDGIGCIVSADGYSFSNNPVITTINLPELINTGYDSFAYFCPLLTIVTLPKVTDTSISCFEQCYSLKTINLPLATAIGGGTFDSCSLLTIINIPSCLNLGHTVGNDSVFQSIIGNNITLTVPSSLMTCNSGNPDGDIQYLQANNTVTITTT